MKALGWSQTLIRGRCAVRCPMLRMLSSQKSSCAAMPQPSRSHCKCACCALVYNVMVNKFLLHPQSFPWTSLTCCLAQQSAHKSGLYHLCTCQCRSC